MLMNQCWPNRGRVSSSASWKHSGRRDAVKLAARLQNTLTYYQTILGGEAHMRTILSIAVVLAGIFVSVMAVSKTVTRTDTVTNNEIYRGMTGIKVSLPPDMKNFPAELVPLP
jgi:hypothetical protein